MKNLVKKYGLKYDNMKTILLLFIIINPVCTYVFSQNFTNSDFVIEYLPEWDKVELDVRVNAENKKLPSYDRLIVEFELLKLVSPKTDSLFASAVVEITSPYDYFYKNDVQKIKKSLWKEIKKKKFNEPKLISIETIEQNGLDLLKLVVNNEGGFSSGWTNEFYIFLANQKAYMIQFGYYSNDYDTLKGTWDKILGSIQLK